MWLRHGDEMLRASISECVSAVWVVCCVATESGRKEAVASIACECKRKCKCKGECD
jgi:hypothetical protein